VQPLHGGQASELGPAVVATRGDQRSVAHETLDLDGINTGVEQVRGERPATVMWAQVADAGFAGPAVDEGIDGLGSEAPDGHSPRLVDRTEERTFFEAPELEPGGHGAAAAGRQCGAALAAALADHGEHAGRRFVVVDVQADGLGPA
jgi:hypothetical protein